MGPQILQFGLLFICVSPAIVIGASLPFSPLHWRLGLADGIAGGKQTIYTAGLNWYVNRNVRFMLRCSTSAIWKAT